MPMDKIKNDCIYVVVPVYNVEKYLERCLNSILNQTYKNIKIIAVDDESPDKCPEICDNYAQKYSNVFVVHQKNKGLAGARNTGIDFAIDDAGDGIDSACIAFVDSDDYIHPQMLETLINLKEDRNVPIAGIDALVVTDSDEVAYESINNADYYVYDAIEFARKYLVHEASVSVCNKLFCLSLFKNLHFCEGQLNEDGLLLYEMILKENCSYAHLKAGMYYYYLRSDSITHGGFSKNIVNMVQNFITIEKITKQYAPQLMKEANDNLLYGCAVFCYTVPRRFFKSSIKSGIADTVLCEVRKRYNTIKSSNLSARDKLVLKWFGRVPDIAIDILSVLRSIKKQG